MTRPTGKRRLASIAAVPWGWRVYSRPTIGLAPGSAMLVGMLLWMGPCVVAGIFMWRAQLRYVSLYRRIRRVPLPLPGELGENDLADWNVVGISWRLWRIVWERQSDPHLEEARRRVVRLWRFLVLWGFLGVFFPIGLAVMAN